MRETIETLKPRRSCRAYQPRQVEEGLLQQVLEAGLYAPSGRGAQPVVFVVVQDQATLAELSRLNAAHALGLGSCWIHRAREVFDSPEGQALLHQWGLEGTYAGVGHCILGYPAADLPPAPPRKPGRVVRV